MAYSDLNNTAKVRFLAGTQASIATLISNGDAIEGAFYLTNDTHRLYVGRQVSGSTDVIPVPVNEGINFVTSVADLPTPTTSTEKVDTAGHFYYASSENVLCVYNGENWVQINPDTDHAVYGSTIAFTPLTSTQTGYSSDALTYNVNIPLNKVDLNNTGATPSAFGSVSGTLTIPKSAINELAGVAVNLAATYDNNTISLKASGSGYDTAATPVVLSAGNNISFTQGESPNTNTFTIAAPSYFMGVDASSDKIGLVSNTGDTVSTGITFAAGSELNVATASAGTITFSHAEKSGLPSVTKGSISGKMIYVPSVSVNKYGHVTSLSESSITLREVTGISASGSTITLTYNNNNADTLSVEIPEFSNYYTSAEVDQEIANKLQALNGLTYMGTADAAPTGSIAIGDMYLVTTSFAVPNIAGSTTDCKVGDLIIANTSATDPKETNGYITESLYWDRIQVDYNTDTTYSFTAASNNKLIVNDSALNQTSFEFASPGSTIAIETVIPSIGKDYTFNFDINWGTF